MPLHPTWQDLALRLLLTMLASTAIGLDRGAKGHAAGLRTSILVGLSASVAMVQANLLLSSEGKTQESFVQIDLMRLPLGILTGVGFIGGGAILRRGDLVSGVTTAATLWVLTVIGLCFGGGQIALGAAATLLSVFTLWLLKGVDVRIPRKHRAKLVIEAAPSAACAAELAGALAPLGYKATLSEQRRGEQQSQLAFEITWHRSETAGPPLDLIDLVNARFAVVSFELIATG